MPFISFLGQGYALPTELLSQTNKNQSIIPNKSIL
jgi:hypothetical protein